MLVVLDLLFYGVFPYLIWAAAKHSVSDYHALLLSTSPSFAYSLFRFAIERQWNVTGLFLIATLLTSTAIDLASGNAEAMIRNNIRTLLGFGVFFLITMLMKRPMAAYFFADAANVWLGEKKKRSAQDFRKPELMPYFQGLTLLFAVRYLFIALAKWSMFEYYGVAGYGILIWWRVALSFAFGAVIVLAFLYVARHVSRIAGS
ncbi:VC0807 family protein [Paenibacillus thermotolerans]|uniref:VC0807 family protein n=1 Tax=Paenibacillus thermotolerans TaxID=3027807 RepID=UPI0023687229|nr:MULTISPECIES: VC0807 family protein [unclassified Paenibacillus]